MAVSDLRKGICVYGTWKYVRSPCPYETQACTKLLSERNTQVYTKSRHYTCILSRVTVIPSIFYMQISVKIIDNVRQLSSCT